MTFIKLLACWLLFPAERTTIVRRINHLYELQTETLLIRHWKFVTAVNTATILGSHEQRN
jgi:hypothetical protein